MLPYCFNILKDIIYYEIINRHNEIADTTVNRKISSMDINDIKIMQDYLSNNFELNYVNKALNMKNQKESKDIEKMVLKKYIFQLNELSAQLTEINVRLSKYL